MDLLHRIVSPFKEVPVADIEHFYDSVLRDYPWMCEKASELDPPLPGFPDLLGDSLRDFLYESCREHVDKYYDELISPHISKTDSPIQIAKYQTGEISDRYEAVVSCFTEDVELAMFHLRLSFVTPYHLLLPRWAKVLERSCTQMTTSDYILWNPPMEEVW